GSVSIMVLKGIRLEGSGAKAAGGAVCLCDFLGARAYNLGWGPLDQEHSNSVFFFNRLFDCLLFFYGLCSSRGLYVVVGYGERFCPLRSPIDDDLCNRIAAFRCRDTVWDSWCVAAKSVAVACSPLRTRHVDLLVYCS